MTTLTEIKNGWTQRKIKDFGRVSTGTTPSTKNKEYYGGRYKLISPADLTDSKYILTSHKLITEEGLKVSRTLPQNAVLVGCIGNIGKIGMTVDEISAFNQQINAVVCNDNFNCDFVYYLLRHSKPLLESKAAKVTLPILNKSNFENIEFEVPDLLEQKAIAQTLTAVQNAIAEQENLIAKFKELKRSMMQHLFTHGTKGEKTKMTEIGKIPESWQVVRLGDVCETSSGGTPSRTKKQYYSGDIPWIKSGEMNDGYIENSEEKITSEAVEKSSAKLFEVGTLLVAMYGATAGKTAILSRDATTNQAVCGIFKNENVNLEFVRYTLILQRDFLLDQRHGGAQPNLSQTSIRNLLIPLPDVGEQNKIAESLVATSKKIEAIQEKLLTYQNLFKTLLHELMSGERRIKYAI
ncbi:MAG: restriction endonuclease subunit S [bacterium]|nr:restriction endonuclease subunit S [bacterium]